jgi:hypothetical protein
MTGAHSAAHTSIRRHLSAGLAVLLLVAGGVGSWAATTDISGAVIASGVLVVDTNVKKVQHPKGGVVGEILAHDGDAVKAGDVVVRLDDTITRSNLTIVTNSAYVASTLAMMPGNRVFMAGTQLRDHDGAAFDRTAFETIERMEVHTCILTASQVHPKRGFLVREQCEADIATAMSSISKQSIFAVDHTKFSALSAQNMVQITGLGKNLHLVSNMELSKEYLKLLGTFKSKDIDRRR